MRFPRQAAHHLFLLTGEDSTYLVYLGHHHLSSHCHQNKGNRYRNSDMIFSSFKSVSRIDLLLNQRSGILYPSKLKRKYPNMKRSLKYCKFHKDFNYSTIEFFSLYKEIEFLILSGYLKEFVTNILLVRKSLKKDKGEQIVDSSSDQEPSQGSKKGIFI